MSVREAGEAFLRDAAARHTAYGTLKNLRLVVEAFSQFAEKKGIRSVKAVSVELVREFREGWTYSPFTAQKKLERLRSFLSFCVDSGWLERNPAKSVKLSITQSAPTIPFAEDEVKKILATCALVPDNWGRTGTPEQNRVSARLRAFILLLRYSGLRIGDAVQLSKEKVQNGRVFLRTEKTGIPVWVPVPPEVTKAIEAIDEGREFYFWSGASTLHTATNKWRARLSKLFKLAGVNGHPHMFRHTLAVTMLGNGSSLETVAAILGNTVRIVEKHYSPWVKSRQEALEAAVKRAWA